MHLIKQNVLLKPFFGIKSIHLLSPLNYSKNCIIFLQSVIKFPVKMPYLLLIVFWWWFWRTEPWSKHTRWNFQYQCEGGIMFSQNVGRSNLFSMHVRRSTAKKKLYGSFLWMGFNCLKARATSRGQFNSYH